MREYVDLPHLAPADLEQALVGLGLEVESIVDLSTTVRGQLVVGQVLDIEELTGFKKPIRFCRVDVGAANGTGEPQEIVCGATNFAPGDRVVVPSTICCGVCPPCRAGVPSQCDRANPNGPRATIDAVAQDGIQLKAKARVTVRTNIDRLVGGAGEETIIARVGEGMVSTIGSAVNHKSVLENPDHISKHILSKGLDAGTAYEILSIDIADVDVGENIGAKLQIDQANADKQIAQAKAEERRAMAVALEQEMRARVVEAEAEVPRAMAEAFRQGNLGIMDYYRMKNVQADTSMRDSIAGTGEDPSSGQKR